MLMLLNICLMLNINAVEHVFPSHQYFDSETEEEKRIIRRMDDGYSDGPFKVIEFNKEKNCVSF